MKQVGRRSLFGVLLGPFPLPEAYGESLKPHLESPNVFHLLFECPNCSMHHPYIAKVASMWHQSSLTVIARVYNTFKKPFKSIKKMYFLKIELHLHKTAPKWSPNHFHMQKVSPKSAQSGPKVFYSHLHMRKISSKWLQSGAKLAPKLPQCHFKCM